LAFSLRIFFYRQLVSFYLPMDQIDYATENFFSQV
jgi:hypothetical protein